MSCNICGVWCTWCGFLCSVLCLQRCLERLGGAVYDWSRRHTRTCSRLVISGFTLPAFRWLCPLDVVHGSQLDFRSPRLVIVSCCCWKELTTLASSPVITYSLASCVPCSSLPALWASTTSWLTPCPPVYWQPLPQQLWATASAPLPPRYQTGILPGMLNFLTIPFLWNQ